MGLPADEYFDGVLKKTTLPVAVVIIDHVGFKNEASGNRCKPADADAVLNRTVTVTLNQVRAVVHGHSPVGRVSEWESERGCWDVVGWRCVWLLRAFEMVHGGKVAV
jgi:hypothetical protein